MSTGTSRLKDMHKGKRAKMPKVTVEDIQKVDSKPQKEGVFSSSAKVVNFSDNTTKITLSNEQLNKLKVKTQERKHFHAVYEQIQAIFPTDHERYQLTAASLAKLYAQQERIENEIENTGGYILEDDKGKLYANPAVIMLQRLQNTILTNLRAIGLTVRGQNAKGPEKDDSAESEFAQFK